jgi:hypothetical protein
MMAQLPTHLILPTEAITFFDLKPQNKNSFSGLAPIKPPIKPPIATV